MLKKIFNQRKNRMLEDYTPSSNGDGVSIDDAMSDSGLGFGPNADSAVDGLFYKSPHMGDVYLNVNNLISETNMQFDDLSTYTSGMTYDNYTNPENSSTFDSLQSSLNDALSCKGVSGLPSAGDGGCLGGSLSDFFENLGNALDETYKMEHANEDAFDELDPDNVNVTITDKDGKTYDSYSEYLLANNSTSTRTNDSSDTQYTFYDTEHRDLTPYSSVTEATGTINGQTVRYTNEVKSQNGNIGEAEVGGEGKTTIKDDKAETEFTVKESREAEYTYYSNSSKFETLDKDGNVVSTDQTTLTVGKVKGSVEIEFNPEEKSFGIKAEGHGVGVELDYQHEANGEKVDLNAKVVNFDGKVEVGLNGDFREGMKDAAEGALNGDAKGAENNSPVTVEASAEIDLLKGTAKVEKEVGGINVSASGGVTVGYASVDTENGAQAGWVKFDKPKVEITWIDE